MLSSAKNIDKAMGEIANYEIGQVELVKYRFLIIFYCL